MNDAKIKILVASHKKFDTSKLESCFLPVLVGANKNSKFKDDFKYHDNDGDNISDKNPYYSELTALYWAWQNLDYDYLGLMQYRRFLEGEVVDEPISYNELRKYLGKYDLLLPHKRYYVIETLKSHYANTFDVKHLDLARDTIKKLYPNYLKDFDVVMKQRSGYMFNLFVMKKKYINQYSKWLFDILFDMEENIDFDNMTDFQKRLLGRVSEILFNVWLHHQLVSNNIRKKQIKTFKVYYVGGEPIVKKAIMFLKAKFLHKKYQKSA